MKILLIQLRRIGDIVLTTPVISYLKKIFPDSQIDFLCEPMGKDVLEGQPQLNEILYYDKNKGLAEIRRIRARRYDVVFDFLNNPRSAYITGFSGARMRVGFKKPIRSLFYNYAIPIPKDPEYIPKRKLRMVQEWLRASHQNVPPVDSSLPAVFLTEHDKRYADEWIKSEKLGNTPFVVFVPIHRHPIRQWRLDGFMNVAQKILAMKTHKVYFSCAPDEEAALRTLIRGHESEFALLPQTSFRNIAAIVQRAKLVVLNDSGTMHFSVAVGTPTVTIYGPTRPADCNPYYGETVVHSGRVPHIFLTAEHVPCLGCLYLTCPVGHLCMNELSDETVFAATQSILKLST